MEFQLVVMKFSTFAKVLLSPSIDKVDGNWPGETQSSPVLLLQQSQFVSIEIKIEISDRGFHPFSLV
jgi:hypothetical protein